MKKTLKFSRILTVGSIIISLGLNNQFSFSQENDKICVGEKLKVKSSILGHDRDILVYLPPRYNQTDESYPVIYSTDAEVTFLLISSLIQVLPQQGFAPNAIVIGITNRGEKERYVDFAPKIVGQPESGRAELFIDFFEKELFPYIENKYRTQPFRILYGHSFLGMFACHVFLTRPELFNAYVISSPDLKWIKENISVNPLYKLSRPTFMYISNGAEENPSQEIETFVELLKSINNLTYTYIENQGENHQSNGLISILSGFRYIYSDWRLPKPMKDCTPAEIENHFKNLSKKYGYEVPIQR